MGFAGMTGKHLPVFRNQQIEHGLAAAKRQMRNKK